MNVPNDMGGTYSEQITKVLNLDNSWVISINGDLREIDRIRDFWQQANILLDRMPTALWINFTRVISADTKLAACIIAILRKSNELEIPIYIIGSATVEEVLLLCKIPTLQQFTKVA